MKTGSAAPRARPDGRWRSWLPAVWTVVLAGLLLGPALGRGYLLTYDMVWVPDLALRPDFWGVGSGLPRAVPSDAVVAILDEVLPGMLLQKVVLLGSLVGAGLGAARLLAGRPLVARLLVAGLAVWNPYVVERLVIGHWPVLLGYAALPWVVDAVRTWRVEGRVPVRLLWLLPLGALSASAGLASGLALVLLAGGRGRWRVVLGLAAAANAPWLVSGLLHTSTATTDALGGQVFALHGEGLLPAPLAALGLGGIWNTEVVPTSRTGWLAVLALVVVLLLAALGARSRRWAVDTREAGALVGCWVVGWCLAVLTWVAPGAVGALASHVPGGGLLRDGSRLLMLCLPLLVLLVGQGAAELAGRFPARRVARGALAVAVVLFPVAVLPDAAWGVTGALRPADYPGSYSAAREVVAASHAAQGGDVLVLPATSFRQPSWNHGVKVFDPLGRFLTPDYVASDVLVVGDVVLRGEDPRVEEAVRVLDRSTPQARSEGLSDLGIGTVVVETDAPGPAPAVAGRVLLETADVTVAELRSPRRVEVARSWIAAMSVAWAAYVAPLIVALMLVTLRLARSASRRRPRA